MATTDDLVHETTAGTGTGNLTIAAFNGRQRFSDAFGTGGSDVFYYFIVNREAAEWEVGTGSMSDANTLVRDTVIASSNADAAVTFSAGTKDVTSDLPASVQLAVLLDAEILALAGLTSAANKVPMFSGAGAATLLDFKDEDSMASDSATALASQQSIKAYADGLIAGLSGTYQPLDSDLTAIAALSTTSFGRAFLALADEAAFKAAVNLEIGTDVQAYDADTAKLDVVQTFTAVQTLTDPAIIGAIKEDVYTITDGAGFEIDPGNGTIQQVTLGANRTPAATNFASGESVTLKVADGSAYTITWTTIGVVWVGGSAPTLATSGYSVIELWKDGSTIYGAYVGDVAS